MSRRYEQRVRAAEVARRRVNTVEAAAGLIASPGLNVFSLDAVARAAGVTRKTLYNQFASKAALLAAVLDFTAERAGVHHLHEASEHPDPVVAARTLTDASCRFWASDPIVFRRLLGLANIDADLRDALGEREHGRMRQWDGIVARLDHVRRLRRGVSTDQAARVLTQLTAFPTFDGLNSMGLNVAAVAQLLLRLSGALVDLQDAPR